MFPRPCRVSPVYFPPSLPVARYYSGEVLIQQGELVHPRRQDFFRNSMRGRHNAIHAAAVAKAQDISEEQVVRCFEVNREKFIQLVNRLTDEDFKDPRITRQLEMELIGHLAEHAIKKDPGS